MNPAKFFLENYKFTMILTLMIVVFGVMGLLKLNSETYPTVDFATATITTRYDGASAEEVETRITKNIEEEIRGVANIKDVRSISQAGKSTIYVRADIDEVVVEDFMADLQRSVDRVSKLPADLREKPRFVEMKSEEMPVLEVAIVGDNKDRSRDKIADLLKENIEDHKSVLNVRLTGYKKRQFKVLLDPARLKRHHVGINEVISKIQKNNVNIPGGRLKSENGQTILRLEGKIASAQDLSQMVLRSNFSGRKITLHDVASVVDGEEDATMQALYNGKPATLLIVTKKGGTDTLALVDELDKDIEAFIHANPDYKFYRYSNEGTKVKNRLDVLTSNAVTGLALVVGFLLIFLPGRIGIMASLSLPLALLATFGFMPLLGMNLNAITILALVIALGMLVDNSVVISENYSRLVKEGKTQKEAALESIRMLWLPITATAFTTIAAFAPMLVTRGIMGEFIKWIPVVVCVALVASLIESFFFLPMRLVTKKDKTQDKKASTEKGDWFQKIILVRFEAFMFFMIKYRYLTAVVFGGLIAGSFYMMFVMNKFVLFPAEQTEIYIARVEMPSGTPLAKTDEVLQELSQTINSSMGEHIDSIVAKSGISQVGFNDPNSKTGDDVGIVSIYVDLHARDNISAVDFLADLRALPLPKKAAVTFDSVVNGPPVGQALNATIRSNSTQHLKEASDKIVHRLEEVPGIINVKIDDVYGDDRIFIDVDERKAARLGFTTQAIGQAIRSGISGVIVSDVNLDNKTVDVQVQMKADARRAVVDLEAIRVMDRRGNLVPIGKIASFRKEPGTPQIKRFDFKRSKTITADIDEAQMTSIKANQVLATAYNEARAEFSDLSIVYGGEGESTKESMQSLFEALILSLIGIFALLVFLFKSYLRPIIIMSTIPLGLVGASVAFYASGRPISFLALIGVIGLGGIIVNSGIILISFIDELKNDPNRTMTLNEILVKASSLRLRSVVVSSLTTISGLFPTAYGIGGSDALLIPMTFAMAWGLTSGTVLTLIWVPPAYGILEDLASLFSKPFLSRFRQKVSHREEIDGESHDVVWARDSKRVDSREESAKDLALTTLKPKGQES